MPQSVHKLLLCSCTLVLSIFRVGNAEIPYHPIQPNPVTEPWRWHTYDPLENKFIYCGTELGNGDLLFVSNKALLRYDGYKVTEEPFPEEYQNLQTFALWVNPSGRIYLNTGIGLITIFDGQWNTILSYDHFYPQSRPLFAESEDGLLVTGTPGGIYILEDAYATQLAPFSGGIGSLLGAEGKLFISPSQENAVYDFPFTREGISNTADWNKSILSQANNQSPYLFSGNVPGEVYALNFIRNNGIFRYSPETEAWDLFENSSQYWNKSFLSGVSTGDNALLIFEKSSTYALQKDDWTEMEKRTFNQPINSVFAFKKSDGNLVIGGRGESVVEVDLSSNRWQSYQDLHYQCEDLDNRRWFISRTGEVVSQNVRSDNWLKYETNAIDAPNTILCSNDGLIWVAGSHQGIAAISRYDGFQWSRHLHPEMGSMISHLSVIQLSDGRILFGSGEELPTERFGIVVYDNDGTGYTHQLYGPPIAPVRIAGIIETENKEIWAGGFGLYKLDYDLQAPYDQEEDLHLEWVDHIQPAPTGGVFVGMWEKGLLQGELGNWKEVSEFNETSGHFVSNMLRDETRKDTLWIATEDGITRLDSEDCVPQTIHRELGMIREEGTLANSGDGSIWINKTDRNWYFSGQQERENNVKIFFSVRYMPAPGSPRIEILDYDARSTQPANVHFSWQGVDKWSVTDSDSLRYSYRIDDDDWSPYSSSTKTILLNFDAGSHSLSIRAKDLDHNVFQYPAPVSFIVVPPVWKRPWFVGGGFTMIAITGLLIYLLIRQRINHLLQLDELKLQFFTNMSHELRTPLMLIIGPLESLLEKLPKGFDRTEATIAQRNSKKILHLVDQILEFRKVEFTGMEESLVKQDVVKDIRDNIKLHQPLATDKAIDLISKCSHEQFHTSYDPGKLDRILSNLITNAIKYTQKNGTILIKTQINEGNGDLIDQLIINIEDDGEGITKDKLKHIFEPFYRVQGNSGRRARGVGLGLSLVKSLLESMNGKISVESPIRIESGESSGTRFTVTIPLKRSGPIKSAKSEPNAEDSDIHPEDKYSDEDVVLIVEDDDEIREYIGNELKSHFSIEFANNGVQGLKKAKSIIPDLILTDVLMPEMDGNELCAHIRANESTSHIPIIALTALNSTEQELKTLTKGADDFLTKPVSTKVLRQKISNAIRSREQLQQNYRNHQDSTKSDPGMKIEGSVDDKFIEKAKSLIKQHLEDPFFDVEILSALLSMSRMTLYRKIKAITGESPSELIRITRLKTAAGLLIAGELNISEIADRVGYQDLSHFSGSFKKYYNCSPSVFQRTNQSDSARRTGQ